MPLWLVGWQLNPHSSICMYSIDFSADEREAFRDKLLERDADIALVIHPWTGHNRLKHYIKNIGADKKKNEIAKTFIIKNTF